MTLRIIFFTKCDIDDNWYIKGQNRRLTRESWDPDAIAVIEAKQKGAGIDVNTVGESMQHLKFKVDSLVTTRGHILGFDPSSLL